eukprot:gene8965-10984_t
MWSYVRNLSSKARAWITAGLGTFAALAVAVALGVFEAQPQAAISQILPGQSLDAGKWRIKPLKAWVTDQKIHGLVPKADQKALVLEVELTNRTTRSDKSYYSTVHLPPGIGAKAEKPMIYLVRDDALMPSLQPGLPEKMAYVWLMPATAIPEGRIDFSIEAEKFKPRDNLYGMPGWFNPYTAAKARLMRPLGNILVVCLAVIVLYALQQTKPHYEDLTGPIPSYGKMHETVHTRLVDLRLEQVDFARELAFTQYGQRKTLTTSGLWAVATAELAATTASATVAAATWVGPTGLHYEKTDRVGTLSSQMPPMLDPGMPRKVRFVFEILPDQVNGATFTLSSRMAPRLDSEARIAIDDFRKFNDGQPLIADSYDLGTDRMTLALDQTPDLSERRWRRRSLCALVLLIPLALFVVSYSDVKEMGKSNNVVPIDVAAGQSARYGGSDWQFIELRTVTEGMKPGALPKNAVLVIARFIVEIGDPNLKNLWLMCSIRLVDATGRSWSPASVPGLPRPAEARACGEWSMRPILSPPMSLGN